MRALASIQTADAVVRCAHPTVAGTLGLASGRLLVQADLDDLTLADNGERIWALHRAELQRALFAEVPATCVTFGAGFERYETTASGLRVYLSNGTTIDTDLLVGADGLHSRVRQQLFGHQPPRYAGYACYRAVCPIPPTWSGVCGEFWGNGDRFGVIELPDRRLYWFGVVSQKAGTLPASDYKQYLRQRFATYAYNVSDILDATLDHDILYHELFDRPPLTKLSSGAVCLLGDAAHPTTPNLGQGAAMAIESAVVLARSLVECASLDEALVRYEHTRLPRTAEVTRRSRLVGQVAQLRNPLLRWLRNWAVRLTPRASRIAQLRPLVEYDASTVPLL